MRDTPPQLVLVQIGSLGALPLHGPAERGDRGPAATQRQHLQQAAQRDVAQLPPQQDLPQRYYASIVSNSWGSDRKM
ncbi:Protein of unknown function [Gryllus bimaculatus]|nr:Protein of unknown function [Gryllus bimaculatus]